MTDQDLLTTALTQYQQDELTAAQSSCNQLLEKHPRNFNARQLLGLVHLKADRFHAALEQFKHAEEAARSQKLAPRFLAQVLSNKALTLEHLNRDDEARTALEEACRLQPSELAFTLNIIALLDRCRDYEAVLDYLAETPAVQHIPETRLPRLRALRSTGATHLAIKWANLWLNENTDTDICAEWLGLQIKNGASVRAALEQLSLSTEISIDAVHLSAWADYLGEEGETEVSLTLYRTLLELQPEHPVARYLVDAAQGQVSPEVSAAYIEAVYNSNADAFEERLVGKLNYNAPNLIADTLSQLPQQLTAPVLVGDIGCGTGLMGEALKAHWPDCVLEGCDLALGMLKLAKRKRLYKSLKRSDAKAWLESRADTFNLITAADVLIYIGEVGPLFKAVAQALQSNGLFAFTVELGNDDLILQANGRYQHGHNYLAKALAGAGLVEDSSQEFNLRQENNQWIKGLLVIARKAP